MPINALLLADIDDIHWRGVPPVKVDLIIACGDIFDEVILEAAAACGCSNILAVKGNHDPGTPFPEPIWDLHRQVVEINGLRFGGLNGSWRYKPKGHFLYDQAIVTQWLLTFPSVDVFISHNSPAGVHDRNDGIHCGFEGLRAYIERTHPAMVIHGHQHVNRDSSVGQTLVTGVYGHRLIELPLPSSEPVS